MCLNDLSHSRNSYLSKPHAQGRIGSPLIASTGVALVLAFGLPLTYAQSETPQATGDATETELRELQQRFGEQAFHPQGGFILQPGQTLPRLIWSQPDLVAKVVANPTIRTQWFNAQFEKVTVAEQPGRYYAYGEAPAPNGPPLRQAFSCYCVSKDVDLRAAATKWIRLQPKSSRGREANSPKAQSLLGRWRNTEPGVVELGGFLEAQRLEHRPGQWQMEEATRHVQLKRKLMGMEQPIVRATVKPWNGRPAPTLHMGVMTGRDKEIAKAIAHKAEEWFQDSQQPMAIVAARNGVILYAKGYGRVQGEPVSVHTPMLLHSAMKPLIGLQLGMYVDQGVLSLDDPIGKYLPDFSSASDQLLTFRAGHVHATGIHFPWDLAFSRLFYFHTWHESLIAHCRREWAPGARHRYGVVGVILSVRALELLRGRNYWDAMERDLFTPLGVRNIHPGGVGFSADGLARIGVVLANKGKYGRQQVLTEKTYQSILPVQLETYFPKLNMRYGIGLRDESRRLGAGSFGHSGGCGTYLAVNPEKHIVFAMVRNDRGARYNEHLNGIAALLRQLGETK